LPATIVNGGGDRLGKVQFSELQKPRELDLGSGHTAYLHASLIDLYLHTEFHWNRKNFLWTDGHTDVPNDGHFRPPLMLLGRLGGVDQKMAIEVTTSSTMTGTLADIPTWILPYEVSFGCCRYKVLYRLDVSSDGLENQREDYQNCSVLQYHDCAGLYAHTRAVPTNCRYKVLSVLLPTSSIIQAELLSYWASVWGDTLLSTPFCLSRIMLSLTTK